MYIELSLEDEQRSDHSRTDETVYKLMRLNLYTRHHPGVSLEAYSAYEHTTVHNLIDISTNGGNGLNTHNFLVLSVITRHCFRNITGDFRAYKL